jgi:ribosome-associated protein
MPIAGANPRDTVADRRLDLLGSAKMGAMSARDDGTRSARQIARGKQRKDGDRSARLAHALMDLSDSAVKRLELEEDLGDAVARARVVTSHIARRRAERALAGDLRRFDLIALAAKLAKLNEGGGTDVAELHAAERWRARLIDEGIAAAESFPGGSTDELIRLIHAARRERDTGRPPGAARALFRHIMAAIKAPAPAAEPTESADPTDDERG